MLTHYCTHGEESALKEATAAADGLELTLQRAMLRDLQRTQPPEQTLMGLSQLYPGEDNGAFCNLHLRRKDRVSCHTGQLCQSQRVAQKGRKTAVFSDRLLEAF